MNDKGGTTRDRADILLAASKLCESREKARTLILAGKVRVGDDHVVSKPSDKFPCDTKFILHSPDPYVSRGALKLIPALDKHLPDLNGLSAMDIGASTGGFTDLMLQRGLAKAYAIDSGRGQLHQKLRDDPRVVCLEKTNARHIDSSSVPEQVDIITMDVSFISATLLIPQATALLKPDGWAFILVKPQFEAEISDVGKGGVVKDPEVHRKTVEKVVHCAENQASLTFLDLIPSPIKGPKGNQEFIAVFRKLFQRFQASPST
ncbi:MAG: TlyA family RNA methyltransferase [Victivallales bacterium]|nr:TlyA family RNA methyltransferase [Victivallales bacterium]